MSSFNNSDFDRLAELDVRPKAKRVFGPNEEPLPLRRQGSQSLPFPIDALGDDLKPIAESLTLAFQTPPAIACQAILASTCLAAQGLRDVEMDGRRSPLSEYFVTIAKSGERKTSVDRMATNPARLYEQNLKNEYEKKLRSFNDETDAFLANRSRILKTKDSREDMESQLDGLGEAPQKPLSPIVMAEDPTYEGIVKLISIGQPSLGLFSSEGGKLLGGIGMNEDHQLKTAAGLSQFWDGEPISRIRAGDEAMLSTKMYGRRLSLNLMIQPIVGHQLLNNSVLLGQGLLARCLIAWPDSTIGTRLYNPINLNDDSNFRTYEKRLLEILSSPKKTIENRPQELNPLIIKPDKRAKTSWIRFHDQIERSLREGKKYEAIQGLGAKIPEHALRLAGVLSVFGDPESKTISLRNMEGGIELARYYLKEALRICQETTESPDLLLAEKLLCWLHNLTQPEFYLAQVYQKGPNPIREQQTAKRIIRILEEHGYISKMEPKKINGSTRKDVWAIRRLESGVGQTVFTKVGVEGKRGAKRGKVQADKSGSAELNFY